MLDNNVKIIGITNYTFALPRLDRDACDNLDDHIFHWCAPDNTLYIRFTKMGAQVSSVNDDTTVGFYEDIYNLLTYIGLTDYIFVLDAWPPPTPKNMLESDFVHAKTLIRSALKIVVNPNSNGADKCTRHQPGVTTNGAVAKNRCKNPKSNFTAFCKAVTFEDKTTSLEFDGMSFVKRKPVMSQYKHNILKSLMAIKAHKTDTMNRTRGALQKRFINSSATRFSHHSTSPKITWVSRT